MNENHRSPSNGRPMTVLVVDDDAAFRLVMQRRLTGACHQVECLPRGEAALDRLAERSFDVVLLDIRMPGLGGLETLKRIREADWPCEVVILTGQPDYDDCVAAMKHGAFHYLCKPTEPALIEETLRRAVDHLRLRRENVALRRMLAPVGMLDFVGESPKLLKLLDHGELRRVGGVRTITVDVRVIVATNRDVDDLVRAGRLRQDLLHRVDVIRITLPPLRERPEDIPRFVTHFLSRLQRRGLGEKKVTPQAMRVLQGYAWPGNVRELANTIERLMILSPGSTIDVEDLPENLLFRKPLAAVTDERSLSLAEMERRHILRVIETAGGNLTAAARRLGMNRGTLHPKMQRWQGQAARVGAHEQRSY